MPRTVKRSLIRHVVYKQNPHGAPVICGRDCPETLLPRSVPDLQLDALAVKLDGADFEVDADGGDEGRGERVFAEPEEAAGLADTAVADEQEFYLFRRLVRVAEKLRVFGWRGV